jgi:hypothetical protein
MGWVKYRNAGVIVASINEAFDLSFLAHIQKEIP